MFHICSTTRLFIQFYITAVILSIFLINLYDIVYAQDTKPSVTLEEPTITDPNLKVEKVSDGISFPTNMAFLGSDDILVLEKNNGTVQRIVNGVMLREPLLDVNVANQVERGLLGVAIEKNNSGPTYVFLYYTEGATKDSTDRDQEVVPLGNRLYRYELAENGTRLIKPQLLLDLPATAKPTHNGGVVIIGPDNYVYLVIGDIEVHRNPAQNQESGKEVDGTSGILRITPDGKPIDHGILSDAYPLNLYYAYGIRNSFGIDFDPITGKLWDTENGDSYGDEINLVGPGFNSGWKVVQGMSTLFPLYHNKTFNPDDLVDFDGKGVYSDPEFSWKYPVGVTSIKFLNSDKLGKQYENDMFVGEFHRGYLYHFDLNEKRTELSLKPPLNDKVADDRDELKQAIFGYGFGAITDIEVGPDGFLYIMSLKEGGPDCDIKHPEIPCVQYNSNLTGTLYKIVPQ
jgi:aldose sugar dehydrogenase